MVLLCPGLPVEFQPVPLQVLARSSPTDKYMLVKLLKKQGEVVAVTGKLPSATMCVKHCGLCCVSRQWQGSTCWQLAGPALSYLACLWWYEPAH